MIKNKRTKTLVLGNQDIDHCVVLEGLDCNKDTPEYDFLRLSMLRTIVENPDLVNCNRI